MDYSDLIIEYHNEDFARAVRQLLPKGQYWQDSDNAELSNLIAGMGAEFKMTHDEIQFTLLTQVDSEPFGWRLSDYQALLLQSDVDGVVYDDIRQPNLILVSLASNQRSKKAWHDVEQVRLPHTAIQWIYNASTTLQVQLGNARYIRNPHTHEATL
ncbi:hypothetical protein PVK64_20365 [Aliivibrio sp. S4TY2]|uniref:hypothetical protein n=1 Tax=unclassified Aliivibrio TaxID=2645654 RepID=UPI002379EA4F|nr:MULTISPECIES: hypothetical protein [unclassified Aliivibrio]MDD9158518.1 hypothetical protein [Aliivibrio sp. S4TY2]MDD9162518.1 hypothetical protein [Aliivibrio sp. S4TY1]MDD9166517.1 hypothetical protein [Aliivibrio sp. S4MY2]MDD9170510.1 hypothetical protein [Aliivibrio sp. S4MY4]MDD9187589.1 hypothetical protein [Aliivibrio sp. S4MY3]